MAYRQRMIFYNHSQGHSFLVDPVPPSIMFSRDVQITAEQATRRLRGLCRKENGCISISTSIYYNRYIIKYIL